MKDIPDIKGDVTDNVNSFAVSDDVVHLDARASGTVGSLSYVTFLSVDINCFLHGCDRSPGGR